MESRQEHGRPGDLLNDSVEIRSSLEIHRKYIARSDSRQVKSRPGSALAENLDNGLDGIIWSHGVVERVSMLRRLDLYRVGASLDFESLPARFRFEPCWLSR